MHYKLDKNKNAVEVSVLEWRDNCCNEERIVKQEEVEDKYISTIFLGLDHNFRWNDEAIHKPLIFETMVFNKDKFDDIYMDRYSTWQEAEEGHKKAVQWVKDGCKDEE